MTTTEDLKVQIAALQIELAIKNKILQDVRKFAESLHDFTDEDADPETLDSDMVAFDLYQVLNGHGTSD